MGRFCMTVKWPYPGLFYSDFLQAEKIAVTCQSLSKIKQDCSTLLSCRTVPYVYIVHKDFFCLSGLGLAVFGTPIIEEIPTYRMSTGKAKILNKIKIMKLRIF